jgi:hypothetical protein
MLRLRAASVIAAAANVHVEGLQHANLWEVEHHVGCRDCLASDEAKRWRVW